LLRAVGRAQENQPGEKTVQALAAFVTMLAYPVTWWLLARHGRKKGWNAFKRHGGGALAGFLGMFVVALALMPFVPATPEVAAIEEQAKDAKSSESAEAAKQKAAVATEAKRPVVEATPAVRTLTFTVDEYAERLNANLRTANLPFRVQPTVENGIFRSMLSDRHALIVNVDEKTGRVAGVLLMAQGDGSLESGMDVFMVGTAAIAAAIPGARMDDGLGRQIMEMVTEAGESNEPSERIRNDVEFGVSRSDAIGMMFSAEPVE
jgi:hypothetical protein